MLEGVMIAILTTTNALALAMLAYLGKRVKDLEAELKQALKDYYSERSTSGAARQNLQAMHDDVDACVEDGCTHRPKCPALAEYTRRHAADRRLDGTET